MAYYTYVHVGIRSCIDDTSLHNSAFRTNRLLISDAKGEMQKLGLPSCVQFGSGTLVPSPALRYFLVVPVHSAYLHARGS